MIQLVTGKTDIQILIFLFTKLFSILLYDTIFYNIFRELKFGWPLLSSELRFNKGSSGHQDSKIKKKRDENDS